MSTLSPLYSWVTNGIMTLPVFMDIGMMCLPLIQLQFYSGFFLILLWLHNPHYSLILLCFHLSAVSACPPGFIILCVRTSTLLFVRPYRSSSTSRSTEIVNREKRDNYPILHHEVVFTWRITLCSFTFGFIPVRV